MKMSPNLMLNQATAFTGARRPYGSLVAEGFSMRTTTICLLVLVPVITRTMHVECRCTSPYAYFSPLALVQPLLNLSIAQ